MRILTIAGVLLLSGLLLAAPPKIVEEISGKVVGVSDGDTLTILVAQEKIKVRLEAIDAPETGQSFGTKSKQALSDLVFGKTVQVKATGKDKYGRSLGFISVGDVDVNARMIENGFAWHFKKYSTDENLANLENAARQAKRGLWAEQSPLAPWDYRARKKAPEPETSADDAQLTYWLNTSSGVRHNSKCESYKNTKRGRLCGPSEGKACGVCGG